MAALGDYLDVKIDTIREVKGVRISTESLKAILEYLHSRQDPVLMYQLKRLQEDSHLTWQDLLRLDRDGLLAQVHSWLWFYAVNAEWNNYVQQHPEDQQIGMFNRTRTALINESIELKTFNVLFDALTDQAASKKEARSEAASRLLRLRW